MKKKIMSILIRCFIKETIIFENSEYPNYNNLKDIGYVNVNTFTGDFTFKIKEDVTNDFNVKRSWGLPNRLFTVELMPLFTHESEKPYYEDKIMLIVKIGGIYLSKRTLINVLVDLYLEKMWQERRSKIANIEVENTQ